MQGERKPRLVRNARRKSGLIDFKIESNQINLQAPFVMEKYAKFQLGKNKLGKIDAAGLCVRPPCFLCPFPFPYLSLSYLVLS